MKGVIAHVKKQWVIYVFTLFYIAIFYKVFFQGLFPFPGDLLASWFFPYSSGGWQGYDPWTTHKEFIAADVVRQLYPWRDLAMDLLRNIELPLWNPYAFSGTPLMANLQTAAFYPVNILFLTIPSKAAWIIYILIQPILAFIGMYIFTRSLKTSKHASLFAGVAFAFVGYFIIWFEHGVVGHSGLWLPYILWGIQTFKTKKNARYLATAALFSALSILAGHAQTAVYVLLTAFAFFTYLTSGIDIKKRIVGGLTLMLGVGVAAIQLIPSLEFMLYSARTTDTSSFIKNQFQMPPEHVLTLFAPDIFGNPATLNFWGVDYGEFVIFAGVPALILAIIALCHTKFEYKWFFVALAAASLIIALLPQVYALFTYLKIPVLGTGIPARVLFLFQFTVVLFAAFGVDVFLKQKIYKKTLFIIMGVYILLWLLTLTNINIFENMPENAWSIAQRNLILPTAAATATISIIFLFNRRRFAKYAIFLILAVAALEYGYLMYKYLPFAQESYVFPTHPLTSHLQENTAPHRVHGYDRAGMNSNLFVQWRVQSVEGYDPLYIRRYGELVSSVENEGFTQDVMRSDAVIENTLPKEDSRHKRRLLNMLSTRYVLDKDDAAPEEWQQNADKFPEDRFELIHQDYKWKVYENRQSFPRAAVFHDYDVIKDDRQIINTLFNKDFPYTRKLILEKDPQVGRSSEREITEATIVRYTPNKVEIEADLEDEGLLFLPDAHYPGWKAYVNGEEEEVLRANYALRAVPLPRGKNEVVFTYQPVSFYAGAGISILSFAALAAIYVRQRKK